MQRLEAMEKKVELVCDTFVTFCDKYDDHLCSMLDINKESIIDRSAR